MLLPGWLAVTGENFPLSDLIYINSIRVDISYSENGFYKSGLTVKR
jgi:hypothetical protein